MKKVRLFFMTYGDVDSLTGGYLYNRRLAEGLAKKGCEVQLISLAQAGSDPMSVEYSCRSQLNKIPTDSYVVLDSLVLGALNQVIKEYRHRLYFLGLIHLPATFDPLKENRERKLSDYEMEAMDAVHHLIVTGRYMMEYLGEAGLKMDKMRLVEPGVDSFPRKQHYAELPLELLCISNYSAIKAQMVLISALSHLKTMKWTLRLYGNMITGNEYVNSLKSYINGQNLQDRIWLYDTLQRGKITAAFLKSDLFLHSSLFESYGMVLTESLAHGIPVITTTAGNIRHTVPAGMGIFTEPGNVNELAAVLEVLFMDAKKYGSLCEAASTFYRQARSWEKAIEEFAEIIRLKM